MTRDEAEEFWASEDDARKDYPGAIRSFVGTVQSLAATERERDELRATVARVEALARTVIHAWDNAAPVEPCDACRGHGFVELWTFEDEKRMDEAVEHLRAALHPEQEAHDA